MKVCDYARYGTKELSDNILKAMEGRTACLMANHGMLATGASLEKAMWAGVELETIAKQYYHALLIGGPVVLPAEEIAGVRKGFASYGLPGWRKEGREWMTQASEGAGWSCLVQCTLDRRDEREC